VFFDRFGQNASSAPRNLAPAFDAAAHGRISRNQKISEQSRHIRRKRAVALGLAVNVAFPMALLSQLSRAHAQSAPQDNSSAAASNKNSLFAMAESSTEDLFKTGVQQYQDGKYEESFATLAQVNPDALPAAEQPIFTDTLTKAQAASQQRKAAREEYKAGDDALKNKQYTDAIKHYQSVSDNRFADRGTQAKAREQNALAQTYAKSSGVDAKSLYVKGRDAFRSGDYATARTNLTAARDAGYKPGLFEESPNSMLTRIDTQEQAARTPTPAPETPAAPQPTAPVETRPDSANSPDATACRAASRACGGSAYRRAPHAGSPNTRSASRGRSDPGRDARRSSRIHRFRSRPG
jgi:hypothetical protein